MKFPTLIPLCFLLTACDSGDIYPEKKSAEETSLSVNAVFTFKNANAFPQNYRIIWGAFVGESPYPLSFETVTVGAAETWQAAALQSAPKNTDRFALALAEPRENKALYFFKRYPLDAAAAEINAADTIDLASFERVQTQIFTRQCIQCHNSVSMAAGLDLTAGNARRNLVGVPANPENSPKNLVTKYNLQNSFLLDVLTERPPTVTTNHTALSTLDAEDDVSLIKAWILSTAE